MATVGDDTCRFQTYQKKTSALYSLSTVEMTTEALELPKNWKTFCFSPTVPVESHSFESYQNPVN